MRTLEFFAAVAGAAVLASAIVAPATISAQRGEPKRTIKLIAKPLSKTKASVRAARTSATTCPPGEVRDKAGRCRLQTQADCPPGQYRNVPGHVANALHRLSQPHPQAQLCRHRQLLFQALEFPNR